MHTQRQIVLDTETTGLSPKEGHRIIEIGAMEISNRRVTENTFHVYINPERMIDPEAIKVHGLTLDFLGDKPKFQDIATAFVDFVSGAELIIHNAPFDVGFLNHELGLLQPALPSLEDICTITDTLAMARKKHIGQRNSLDALCKRYQIDNTNRTLHGALIDTELLAYVYLAMTSGQSTLFSDEPTMTQETHSASGIQSAKAIASLNISALKVQIASEQENIAHQHYLKQMREKGSCLWPQEHEKLTSED